MAEILLQSNLNLTVNYGSEFNQSKYFHYQLHADFYFYRRNYIDEVHGSPKNERNEETGQVKTDGRRLSETKRFDKYQKEKGN